MECVSSGHLRLGVIEGIDVRYNPLDPPNPEVDPPPEPPEELVALGAETDWAADVGPVVIVAELAAVVVNPVDIVREKVGEREYRWSKSIKGVS